MRLLVPLLAACALTACGNDAPRAPAEPRVSAEERVIRAWTDDLRRGDEAAAAARFALPATVANGTKPLTLTEREEILAFQESLTCGAVVVATEPHHGLILTRFRLTERPGGDCGDGAGGYAAAAIEVKDGRIARWLRIEDPEPPAPSGPLV